VARPPPGGSPDLLIMVFGGHRGGARGDSASPPVDCLVFGSAVKGGYAVATRFASLTLDRRPGDQDWLVIGEAEEVWSVLLKAGAPSPGRSVSKIRAPFVGLLR
jgi:hypothetical protein